MITAARRSREHWSIQMNALAQRIVATAIARAPEKSRTAVGQKARRAIDWLEAEGRLSAAAISGGTDAFLAALEVAGVVHNATSRTHWRWVAGKLVDAAQRLEGRLPTASGPSWRTSAIDAVIPDSDLDVAIAAIVGEGRTVPRQRVMRCDLALFLTFAAESSRDVHACDLVDLEQFRSWLGENGPKGKPRRRDRDQPVVMARRLIRRLGDAGGWLEGVA
jgi:hypothetical protein